MELEALQEVWPHIKEAGATLVAISPQREQYLHQMAKRHNLTFEILRDKGNEVAAQFGLRFTLPEYLEELYRKLGSDLERFNGDDSWTLPMPARFIILQDSIIAAADADPDYTVRPDPSKTVEALKAMQAK
jgi:peroxiredoxin